MASFSMSESGGRPYVAGNITALPEATGVGAATAGAATFCTFMVEALAVTGAAEGEGAGTKVLFPTNLIKGTLCALFIMGERWK